MPSLIAARGIELSYSRSERRYPVLRGLDLDVERGEMVAVTGPSGSGKSSALCVLGLLRAPDSGDYLFDGQRTGELSPQEKAAMRARSIGFVFQNYLLLPRKTALENVQLPLQYRRAPAAESALPPAPSAGELLSLVGMADKASQRSGLLSGGEQQRVAIARALANGPSLLLADEPTGALDSATGSAVLDLLRDLNRSARLTIVLITHDPVAAARCDRQVVLRDGRLRHA